MSDVLTPGVDPKESHPELTRESTLNWLNWAAPQKTKWGASTEKFGHADYWAALMNVRDEDKQSSQQALKTQRQRVLDWLTGEGKQYLIDKNKPGYINPDTGKAAGLYENIKADSWPAITEVFGDHSSAPDRHKWFGHADLAHALATGKTRADILAWVQEQGATNILRDKNVPGSAGGIYEWLLDDSTTDATPDNPGTINDPTMGDYTAPPSEAPNVTRNTSSYPTLGGVDITRPSRNSLKIKPGDTMIPKGAMSLKTPKRKKYEQTTDLARQARNSLNIS